MTPMLAVEAKTSYIMGEDNVQPDIDWVPPNYTTPASAIAASGAAAHTCRLNVVSSASTSSPTNSTMIVGPTWMVWISSPVTAQPSGCRPNASIRNTLF